MGKLLLYQPFKSLYALYFVSSLLLFKVPFWFVYYSRRANRPRSSWTLARSVTVPAIRALVTLIQKIGSARDLSKDVPQRNLEKFNASFVRVDGLEDSEIVGEIRDFAEQAGVQPVSVPCFWLLKRGVKWIPKHEMAGEDEKVILHIHGGGFVIGTAHPSDLTATITKGILKHTRAVSRVFSVDYRLSSSAPSPTKNPFPAALLDAVSAYKYLVCTVGFLPKNVIVMGDSAGGNLAIGLTRYLIENHIPHLPPPGRLVLISAWTDLTQSRADPTSSLILNLPSDVFIPGPESIIGEYTIRSYLGPLDHVHASTNRYFSPTSVHVRRRQNDKPLFVDFPKTYVIGGGAEIFYDDLIVLVEMLKEDGVDVQVDFPPDAIHDFLEWRWHEPELTESLQHLCKWIDDYGHL